MNREPIIISWEILPGDRETPGGRVVYQVNGKPVGMNEAGWSAVMQWLLSHPDPDPLPQAGGTSPAGTTSQKGTVTLKGPTRGSLGGAALEDTLPFGEKWAEFKKALEGRKIVYDLS